MPFDVMNGPLVSPSPKLEVVIMLCVSGRLHVLWCTCKMKAF